MLGVVGVPCIFRFKMRVATACSILCQEGVVGSSRELSLQPCLGNLETHVGEQKGELSGSQCSDCSCPPSPPHAGCHVDLEGQLLADRESPACISTAGGQAAAEDMHVNSARTLQDCTSPPEQEPDSVHTWGILPPDSSLLTGCSTCWN